MNGKVDGRGFVLSLLTYFLPRQDLRRDKPKSTKTLGEIYYCNFIIIYMRVLISNRIIEDFEQR